MQKRKYKVTSWVVLLTTLAGCGGGGGSDDPDCCEPPEPGATTSYAVEFSSDQVVLGTPVTDSVTATASLQTTSGLDILASGSVTVSGVSATAVTINLGSAGEVGPVILNMESGSGGTWRIPSGTTIDRDELYILESSGFYVAVEAPSGRLRGQILPPGWDIVMVDLTAEATVPATGAAGSAKGGFAFNLMTGDIRARITTSGVNNVMSANIRNAIAGARGDVSISLEQATANGSVWGTSDVNDPDRGDRLTSSGATLFRRGSLYMSVETPIWPEGEVRGQLLPDGVDVIKTELVDFAVVTNGAPVLSDGIGQARTTYQAVTGEFGVAVNTDLVNALSVFVHQGATGNIGPGVYSLTPDVVVSGNWVLQPTELTPELTTAIENDELYVSIVTPAYPFGELRGQINLTPISPVTMLEATVDESTRQQSTIGASGGSMALTTSNGVSVKVDVPQLARLNDTEFSMTEITSVSGFPTGVNVLAAVQMGPADELFANPVELSFDVSSVRSPDTLLAAFITTNDGARLRLVPVRDATGAMSYSGTARHGSQVSVNTSGFSNIGLFELLPEVIPDLISYLLLGADDPEFESEMLAKLFNVMLNTDLDPAAIEAQSDEAIVAIIRKRRGELDEFIEDFVSRPAMSADFQIEFTEIVLASSFTSILDRVDRPSGFSYMTSKAEYDASVARVFELTSVYGAGLHLRCFVDPEGLEDVLESIALLATASLAEELLEENPDLTFEELFDIGAQLSRCYSQPILDAYFESFDLLVGDEFDGTATNIVDDITDNINNTRTVAPRSDIQANFQLREPRLVSEDPLIFEFTEASDNPVGLYSDVVRLVFEPVSGVVDRLGRIELSEEETLAVPTSATDQANGERPIVTFNVSAVASGPVVVSPNAINISYSFDYLETNNGLLRNLSINTTGDVQATKTFTPRSFAEEIDLEE